MIRSSVWQAAWTEGSLRSERDVCLELIRKRHPALLAKATPVVEACDDHTLLLDWIVSTGQLDDAGFARLLGIGW
jgi:hypothetical protein